MKISELIPKPEYKTLFKLSSFKLVPRGAGCYALTTFDDNILYIGLTINFFDRFQQHLANFIKVNSTAEGKAIWFYYMEYDPKNLPKLERTWLNQFQVKHGRLPVLNSIDAAL